MENKKLISVSEDFSRTPAGRFPDDGAYCGENFREHLLAPALREHDIVEVILDGTRGYGSSFLEEAFGGLIRKGYLQKNDAVRRLHIVAQTKPFLHYKSLAEKYLRNATLESV